VVTIIRECNYPINDAVSEGERMDADFFEHASIRKYLEQSNRIPVMVRKLRASLANSNHHPFMRSFDSAECAVCHESKWHGAHF